MPFQPFNSSPFEYKDVEYALDLPPKHEIENDLKHIAGDDIFGRKLQDAGLETKKRAPKTKNDAK